MRKNRFLPTASLALAATLFFTACKKDDPNTNPNNPSTNATLQLRLTDGPGNYDAVLIDIQQMEVHTAANGWQSIPVLRPGIYNLLDFNNGLDTLLCSASLPAGAISQLRMILGPNNSVVVNGVTHPLSTPSAQQSGLKFNVQETLQPGMTYRMWIDFDAGKSIVEKGNGDYSLKPVIRTYTDLTNGRIEGFVFPGVALPVVWAINGFDTMSSIPDANGYYKICGLPAANYTVIMDADNSTPFMDSVINNVGVTFGLVTNLGTVTLHP